jgi:hypothetical protein
VYAQNTHLTSDLGRGRQPGEPMAGDSHRPASSIGVGGSEGGEHVKGPYGVDEPIEQSERDEMEALLGQLCGNLGEYRSS